MSGADIIPLHLQCERSARRGQLVSGRFDVQKRLLQNLDLSRQLSHRGARDLLFRGERGLIGEHFGLATHTFCGGKTLLKLCDASFAPVDPAASLTHKVKFLGQAADVVGKTFRDRIRHLLSGGPA